MARTGGMRLASDVTLESGFTRLLLGSCSREGGQGKKKKNGECEYNQLITNGFAGFSQESSKEQVCKPGIALGQ